MKLTKRLTSFLVALIMIMSVVPSAYALSFPDISGHWGESYILKLIEDGTINGYTDNTFRPDSTVTRAEFVKMIGKSNEKYASDFKDVPTTHWGYDYIMYSGMEVSGNEFNPDTPITRNDVVNLIWKRNGSITGTVAPGIIKTQGTNSDAVAWAYTNGLIIGNDGLHLRLDESLTRAEASTLIIRARSISENTQKLNFVDTVSDEIISVMYDTFNLFDTPYNADETITNGEMARAVLRYGTRNHSLKIPYLSSKKLYEGEYARDLYLISKECISEKDVTKEFESKPALTGVTLAELVYNAKKLVTKSVKMPVLSDYEDTKTIDAKLKNHLAFAGGYDVLIYNEEKIMPDKEITKKEFMCYLIQLDEIIGYGLSYETKTPTNHSISKNVAKYVANYTDYEHILKDVPQIVYSTPIGNKLPKDCTKYGYDLASSFKTLLNEITAKAEKANCMINLTYYPTLVSENDDGIIIRVKLHVLSVSTNKTVYLSSIVNTYSSIDISLTSNKTAYLDILIPPMLDVYIPSDIVSVISVIE